MHAPCSFKKQRTRTKTYLKGRQINIHQLAHPRRQRRRRSGRAAIAIPVPAGLLRLLWLLRLLDQFRQHLRTSDEGLVLGVGHQH